MIGFCLVLGWQCLCRRTRGRNVCLLGLSNSGKTLLFLQVNVCVLNFDFFLMHLKLQLTQGNYGPTQNSIAENVFKNYEPEKKKVKRKKYIQNVRLKIYFHFLIESKTSFFSGHSWE